MTLLSDDEIYQEVGKIVTSFDFLECYECAQAVMQWLQQNGVEGKIIRLRTRYKNEDFILSRRLVSQGVNDSITINGKHYGVEVRGKVFDNLSSEGMTRSDWLNDFYSRSDQFDITDIEF